MLRTVAKGLKPVLDSEKTVFVGGSVVGLLITDIAASDIRPTKDVDIIVSVQSLVKYNKIEQRLRDAGFKQPMDIICRWNINSVIVDIMPTNEEILGFSNRWYAASIKESKKYSLDEDTTINVISPPCFLGTKMEAFRNRGKEDFLGSHDIEDIINLIDGRPDLNHDIQNTSKTLKKFLVQKFKAYLKKPYFHESIKSNLPPDSTSQARYSIIVERLEEISKIAY